MNELEERIKELKKQIKEHDEILEIISKFMSNQVIINKNINDTNKAFLDMKDSIFNKL